MAPSLRFATPADGAALAGIYAPFVTDSAVSFEDAAPDAAEMARRVAAALPQWPWLVAVEDDAVVAYAYAGSHRVRPAYRWSVEVSAYVAEGHHRRGLGRRLYTALLDLLREQGYRRAFAGVTLPNAGSVGLHEAMGFLPVGVYPKVGFKGGAWHDVGWWTLELLPAVPNPPEPASLVETRGAARLG